MSSIDYCTNRIRKESHMPNCMVCGFPVSRNETGKGVCASCKAMYPPEPMRYIYNNVIVEQRATEAGNVIVAKCPCENCEACGKERILAAYPLTGSGIALAGSIPFYIGMSRHNWASVSQAEAAKTEYNEKLLNNIIDK